MLQPINVTDDGRLAGTRITVYDVVYYHFKGRSPTYTAAALRIATDEVGALLQYFEAHRDEVTARHHRIEERNARGNPPEIEAVAEKGRQIRLAWMAEYRRQREARNGDGHPG